MEFDFKASGRLCVRQVAEGYMTVGVLRFPPGFRPEVGTGYPLVTTEGRVEALPYALSPLPPIELSGGIAGWAHLSDWRETPECIMARFIDAAPVGWTTLSVSRRNPFPELWADEDFSLNPHHWVDIEDGQAKRIPPPVPSDRLRGTALVAILREFPVWPDVSGNQFWSLPVLTLEARHAYDLTAALRDLESAGKIAAEDVKSFNRLPLMARVMPMHVSADRDYSEFLALSRSYGVSSVRDGLSTASETRRIDEFAAAAFRVLADAGMSAAGAAELLKANPERSSQLRMLASRSLYEASPAFYVCKSWQEQDLHWVANDRGDLVAASVCTEDGVWERLEGVDFDALQSEVHSLTRDAAVAGQQGALLAANVDILRVPPGWAQREMAVREAQRQEKNGPDRAMDMAPAF